MSSGSISRMILATVAFSNWKKELNRNTTGSIFLEISWRYTFGKGEIVVRSRGGYEVIVIH